MWHRLCEHLADDEFVSTSVAKYYQQSCTLTTLSIGLKSAMLFARAIGLAADDASVSRRGRQLVLAAGDDVLEQTAREVVKEAMLGCALEHARRNYLM